MRRSFRKNPFRLLDIGSGNHSASKTCRVFPLCEYYGVDKDKNYNNDQSDFNAMTEFYEMDLKEADFSNLPDNYFDGLWMVHVIEHLQNGEEIIKELLPKIKKGGFIFIEYPGKKSLHFPSMYGTLNFYDDPTHVRLYKTEELKILLDKESCSIIKYGIRRNWIYIFLLPVRIIQSLFTYRRIVASVFWDILGFAEFVYAKKMH